MATKLIQLYYEDSQKVHCYPFADLHFTGGLTIFYENYWIEKFVREAKTEKIAVCSWRLKEKLRTYIGIPRPITQEVLETDYDVMTFTRNTKYHQMLEFARAKHPGFKEAFTKILQKIGVTEPHEVKIPIYQNHHCSRTEIYKDYVKNYLTPAMDCIKNDKEVNALAMSNSMYTTMQTRDVSSEYLMQQIGVPFYPLAPFLLERLFSVYVHNKRLNVTYL